MTLLSVPPRALATAVDIMVTEASSGIVPANIEPLSNIYSLEPHALEPQVPARFTIPW